MAYALIPGNCLDHLSEISATACVTDPPYGRNYKPSRTGTAVRHVKGIDIYNRQWKQIAGENQRFDPAPFLDFKKVCLWGANHYADKLPASQGWFIWDKRVTLPSNDQADCEMAWTNQDRAARVYRQMWSGVIREGEENIGRAGSKLHPHQKPVALMMWCLEQLSLEPGQWVFDPFMGSGTTGEACIRMGLNFIGCEIDPGYFQIAERRLAQAERQIPLIAELQRVEQARMFD